MGRLLLGNNIFEARNSRGITESSIFTHSSAIQHFLPTGNFKKVFSKEIRPQLYSRNYLFLNLCVLSFMRQLQVFVALKIIRCLAAVAKKFASLRQRPFNLTRGLYEVLLSVHCGFLRFLWLRNCGKAAEVADLLNWIFSRASECISPPQSPTSKASPKQTVGLLRRR